jgi:hypothetical protein
MLCTSAGTAGLYLLGFRENRFHINPKILASQKENPSAKGNILRKRLGLPWSQLWSVSKLLAFSRGAYTLIEIQIQGRNKSLVHAEQVFARVREKRG